MYCFYDTTLMFGVPWTELFFLDLTLKNVHVMKKTDCKCARCLHVVITLKNYGGDKFLKKLWCCVGGSYKVIWIFLTGLIMKIGHLEEFESWRFEDWGSKRQLLNSLWLPVYIINSVDKTQIILEILLHWKRILLLSTPKQSSHRGV